MGVQVCSNTVPSVSLRRLLPTPHGSAPTTSASTPAYATRVWSSPECSSPHCRAAAATAKSSSPRRSLAAAAPMLSERPVPEFGLPNCVVANARDAYGRICQALAGNPSHRLKLIGITGTNGKTTTSCLRGQHSGRRQGIAWACWAPSATSTATRSSRPRWTTPPAGPLAKLARPHGRQRLLPRGNGSVQSCLEPVARGGRQFDAACVTNVSRDHLDYHATIQDYRLTKSKLFEHMSPEGFAVINADDPIAAGYLRPAEGPALTVGIRAAAEITAAPSSSSASEQTFLLTAGSRRFPSARR